MPRVPEFIPGRSDCETGGMTLLICDVTDGVALLTLNAPDTRNTMTLPMVDEIVAAMDSDTVIMTPDQYLAQNVANQSKKKVVYWPGSCIVHELYTAEDLRAYLESR